MSIYNTLNDMQQEAVRHTEGPLLVLAGAGSGKTRVLTHRIAYLIEEKGVNPWNIMAITFTNKAAGEMRERVDRLVGFGAEHIWVSTFHSSCVRILRRYIDRIGYENDFTIYDADDQKTLMKEVCKQLNIDTKKTKERAFLSVISQAKDALIGPLAYAKDHMYEFEMKPYVEAYKLYQEKLKKNNALDFDDLIFKTVELFRACPDVLESYQERFRYIMVDEFQDITVKEFKLIRRLSEYNRNLFVVGDPDQNIYEWRGANMSVIVDFEAWLNNECFENQLGLTARDIILNRNYRSASPIISVANSLIEKNRNRVKKELFTNAPGNKVQYLHAKNDKEEIKYICSQIRNHIEAGGKYADFAVLYRSTYVSRFVEQGFLAENIPYVIYGGVGFYERTEIKDVLSYMRLVDNTGDDLSFKRIINVPRRKIGKIKLKALADYAAQNSVSLYDALKANCESDTFKGCKAKEFVATIEKLREKAEELSVSELLQHIIKDTGYELYIRESGDIDRLDNVTELLRSIVAQETEFGEHLSLSAFLQNITLLRDSDVEDASDRVKIMTIHTSKGLEFDNVFLVGLTEGSFPSARSLEERKNEALEEERRLCFVAVTRAKKRLYLTESEGFGAKGFSKVPSRFLFDIDKSLLEQIGVIPDGIKAEYMMIARKFDKTDTEVYKVGDQVRHKIFGEGIIEEVDERTKTYYIRFVNGTKPINFDYTGLSHIF